MISFSRQKRPFCNELPYDHFFFRDKNKVQIIQAPFAENHRKLFPDMIKVFLQGTSRKSHVLMSPTHAQYECEVHERVYMRLPTCNVLFKSVTVRSDRI